MSADDYVMLRKHPDGGFTFVHGFASEASIPQARGSNDRYDTIEDALRFYSLNDIVDSPEYGLRIHPECFGPREQQFMVSIYNGDHVPRTLITVTGNSDNGYSVRNYERGVDDQLPVVMATPTLI